MDPLWVKLELVRCIVELASRMSESYRRFPMMMLLFLSDFSRDGRCDHHGSTRDCRVDQFKFLAHSILPVSSFPFRHWALNRLKKILHMISLVWSFVWTNRITPCKYTINHRIDRVRFELQSIGWVNIIRNGISGKYDIFDYEQQYNLRGPIPTETGFCLQ